VERSVERAAVFHIEFLDDLRSWAKNDRNSALRVLDLVDAVFRDPFSGPGKARAIAVRSRRVLVQADYSGTPARIPRGQERIDFLQAS
jgi:toxin YoeB